MRVGGRNTALILSKSLFPFIPGFTFLPLNPDGQEAGHWCSSLPGSSFSFPILVLNPIFLFIMSVL